MLVDFYVIIGTNSKNDLNFFPMPSHFPENQDFPLSTDFSMKILFTGHGQLVRDSEKQMFFSDLGAQNTLKIMYRMPEKCSLLYQVTKFLSVCKGSFTYFAFIERMD